MGKTLGLSRRDFMKHAVGAGAMMASGAAFVRAHADARPVRVGVVGVGARGTHLLHTLLQIPGVEILAIADIDEGSAIKARDIVQGARGAQPALYTAGERDYEKLVGRDDLDAVLAATPMQWHAPIMIAAMRAGKYGATEVPACVTLDECHELVKTSEETGKPCMMLENVCYFQNVLTLLRMVREGCFGELLHAQAGYQHDVRFLLADKDGNLTWRGENYAKLNGNIYPTHPIGPIAQWFDINRGDRFTKIVSMSTKARGVMGYVKEKFGEDHPLAKRDYAHGDINTSLIETENGLTVTLYHDTCTPRPYDLIFRLQGTQGLYMGSMDKVYIEGVSPVADKYEDFAPYMEKYAHPLWEELEEEALRNGGHGGSDYITVHEFVKAVREGTRPPQDVYDAATWSVIVPLSIESVARGGVPMDFPDFTDGKWRTNPPITVRGA